jgi:N-acetylglucosaminyldiphosphoundecaprenol N-acetyl-beta-D-mannosaminyltransferase
MESKYPGVCVAGRYSPEFKPLDKMDHEEILRRIEAARPDILLVAFGNPKQEKWLAMHRHRLKVPLCIGVGASLDFLSGKVNRAPRWMQSTGLEWVYRVCQEPARLAKRYLVNAAGVLCYLTLQLAATAAQAGRNSSGQMSSEKSGAATVFRIEGSFTSSLLSSLETEVCSAIFSGSHIVLDLSHTAYLGPDALGSLVNLVGVARRWKRELWLTGLRPFLMRVICATRLRSQFRVAPKVADALRRIEPDSIPMSPKADENWALCRIGGQMIPIHPYEVQDLYHQMQLLVKHNGQREKAVSQHSLGLAIVEQETVPPDDCTEKLRRLKIFRKSPLTRDVAQSG